MDHTSEKCLRGKNRVSSTNSQHNESWFRQMECHATMRMCERYVVCSIEDDMKAKI